MGKERKRETLRIVERILNIEDWKREVVLLHKEISGSRFPAPLR